MASPSAEQKPLDKHIEALLLSLDGIREYLKQKPESEDLDPRLIKAAVPSMCRALKVLVPDIHQKIGEIIYASEHPELTICKHQHGADLQDDKGNKFEHKVSVCKPNPRYAKEGSVNFNWPVPKVGRPSTERRVALLASIKHKVKGGAAIFEVTDSKGEKIASFSLGERFLVGYFERVTLGKSGVHNMGCKRCLDCLKFHRLAKFQHYSDLLDWDVELTDEQWKKVLENTKYRCHKQPSEPVKQ